MNWGIHQLIACIGELGPNVTAEPPYIWGINPNKKIIMKALKLFSMAMLAMAITLVSCSGEDGEQGIQGKQGEQGEQGPQGEQGNANVQAFSFDISDEADYTQLPFDVSDLLDDTTNYAYLYYIEYQDNIVISMPGNLGLGNGEYTTIANNVGSGDIVVQFFQSDDTGWNVPGGLFTDVTIIAVELSNTSKNSENIMSELKSAGVDTSDYNAVAAYFGLK